jgi:hypothetical protein
MTVPSSSGEARGGLHWPPMSILVLGVLLVLLMVGAIQGGWAMVTNPIDPLGMSLGFLERAPVDDYFWPGMFLLGIAVASAVTIGGVFLEWEWSWAAPIEQAFGFRWPWISTMSIGFVLLAFEIVELFVVPFHPVLHPLLIAGSIAILVLASTRSARRHLMIDDGV